MHPSHGGSKTTQDRASNRKMSSPPQTLAPSGLPVIRLLHRRSKLGVMSAQSVLKLGPGKPARMDGGHRVGEDTHSSYGDTESRVLQILTWTPYSYSPRRPYYKSIRQERAGPKVDRPSEPEGLKDRVPLQFNR